MTGAEHSDDRNLRQKAPPLGAFRLGWELARYRPQRFALCLAGWTIIHATPAFLAIFVARMFGALDRSLDGVSEGGEPTNTGAVWILVVAFMVLAVARNGVLWLAVKVFVGYYIEQTVRLQRNLLGWLLEAEGSRQLPKSPGEAVSTFRDDSTDLMEYLENYIDAGGIVVFLMVSTLSMAAVDVGLTVAVVAPLLLVLLLIARIGPEIRDRRRRLRRATESVTGLIGEAFGAIQAVKLAAAEEKLLAELRRRNAVRRRAALSDTVLTEVMFGINRNMATLSVAVVLTLSAVDTLPGRALNVEELTLFLAFVPRMTYYVSFFGNAIAQHRRASVSFERLHRLAVDAPNEALLDRRPLSLTGEVVGPEGERRPDGDPLVRLEVHGLASRFAHAQAAAGNGRRGLHGVGDVSFTLERGSFTVLVGRVGSGKTTILRALLGLIPSEGEVRWNGKEIADRASFLVPPRSAYTPQIPRLLSDTLAHNITLREESTALEHVADRAAYLAVLDHDIPRLADGFATVVGARGVKLSGGQVQRSAVARMLATEADLLVFDDLSSALDLHTEAELWSRLFAHREDVTCLVASHRPAALERADQILVVDGGTIVDRGKLHELLDRSPVMADIWPDQR